jgi:hypothetical protein
MTRDQMSAKKRPATKTLRRNNPRRDDRRRNKPEPKKIFRSAALPFARKFNLSFLLGMFGFEKFVKLFFQIAFSNL